jgi:hypothetical protein
MPCTTKEIKPSQKIYIHKDLPISRTICKRNHRGSFEDGKIPFPIKKIMTINMVLTYKKRKAKCNMASKRKEKATTWETMNVELQWDL